MNVTSISEQLIFTTIRIDTETSTGDQFSGTGFIVEHTKNKNKIPFLVTNKHVVKDAKKGFLTFLRKDNNLPDFGNKQNIVFENFESLWYGHPADEIDVSVMPFGPVINQLESERRPIFFKYVGDSFIPTKEQQEELDAIEEVTFIGYPKSIRDEHNLTPITRRGITATPLNLDYENKPVFLIDAPVFEGSSGSPVFILNQGSYATRQGTSIGTRVLLLGIIAESTYYFERTQVEKIKTKSSSISKTRQFLDLGVVYKVETINQTIDHALQFLNLGD